MKKIYIYSLQKETPGVKIIIDHLVSSLLELKIKAIITNTLENIEIENNLIIPIGIKESYILTKRTDNLKLALLLDAYTLGCINKFKFYLLKRKFNYYDLYYSLLSFIRYIFKELIVVNKYDKIMVVSPYDKSYLKRINKNADIICIPNGVTIPTTDQINQPNHVSKNIRLGVISHWTNVSFNELKWFLEDYFCKLKKEFPNIELIIAGKGASSKHIEYFESINGVKFIGEVRQLNDFFKIIDIFVATLPKGCGILNKVLDAFSFRKYVIGLRCCFKAFPGLKNGFYECDKYDEFVEAINFYINNPKEVEMQINNAESYIKLQNNWEKNYLYLSQEISTLLNN